MRWPGSNCHSSADSAGASENHTSSPSTSHKASGPVTSGTDRAGERQAPWTPMRMSASSTKTKWCASPSALGMARRTSDQFTSTSRAGCRPWPLARLRRSSVKLCSRT
jgi:hypothetical protein